MESRRTIYAVSVDGDVSYVKGKGALYLHSRMSKYEQLEPYIQNKRGVYLLIGQGKAYIGEGDVFSRLTRHRNTKHWVEDVYVYLTDDMMTKEDSLQYEGALERYIRLNTNYDIQNKVKVRVNDIGVTEVVKSFKWLGLEVQESERYEVDNLYGDLVFTVTRTSYNTLKITAVHKERLHWLTGNEFKSLHDLTLIANTLTLEEEMTNV